MRKIAVGQAGGPTAVINASLVGFLDNLNENVEIYGVINGYQGLAENEFERLEGETLDWVKQHKNVPGACLGSGRYLLTDEKIADAVRNLKNLDICSLVFIGGNGTMAALQRISMEAKSIGYNLQVIGIPKTVDNDLFGTDHAPGFGSAAKYVALATRDISKDLEAMKNFEQVRIIETMGRNSGWLAAASGLLKGSIEDGPHLIYIPEVPVTKQNLLLNVQDMVKEFGMATVVVSEGVRLGGQPIGKSVLDGRVILGGISSVIENLVTTELGLVARAEILGMNQRSFLAAASSQDRIEAYEAGKKAAELLLAEQTQLMVSIQRSDEIHYTFKLESCPLEKVAKGGERLLPAEFSSNYGEYNKWLTHLIGEHIPPYPPALKRRGINEKQYSGCK
ncbi:diphosphate--fructose-6-phosphate 1-phosphotransferase [Metabacillus sp. Hm71]|uniref:diphosphate--fructose-6-phosphate 1-phosphotransferase n=1 Tax=Metabacillus sp. Hm71 TaxID=3450743 RepID=UPI003F422B8E